MSEKIVESSLRIAVDAAKMAGLSLSDLMKMISSIHREVNGNGTKAIRVGSLVRYTDPKRGPMLAHVLEVRESDHLKLRVHRTASPNIDVDNVPYAEAPTAGYWSRR